MTIKCHNEFLNLNFSTLNYLKKKKLNDPYDVIKASLIFMSCLKLFGKKVKTAKIQIAISLGLIGIFACGFLPYDH